MKVQGKVIVVTGGGSGLGREIVKQLVLKGARVAAIDINMEGLKETHAMLDLDQRVSLHKVDITDKNAVMQLVKDVEAFHGQVDGLINNAGIIQPFKKIVEMDDNLIQRVISVNFFGTVNMTKAFLPALLERKEGHLLNISSMGGVIPVPGQGMYGASKAAVKLMTESMDAELVDTKVNVSVVVPGGIDTAIIDNTSADSSSEGLQKTKLLLSPQKAAELIIKGMEKDKVRITIGTDSKIMNVLYRLNPAFAGGLMKKALGRYAE